MDGLDRALAVGAEEGAAADRARVSGDKAASAPLRSPGKKNY